MTSVVARSFAASHRRRATRARVLTLLLLTIVSIEGIRRLSFDSDVLSLLPQDGRVIQAFRTFVARFGSLDQLYVVFTAPEGSAISDYSDDVDAWVEGLRGGAGNRARGRGRRRSHARLRLARRSSAAAAAGRPLDEALQRLTPDGMAHAVAAGASCCRCRPRRWRPLDPTGSRSACSICCAMRSAARRPGTEYRDERGRLRHRRRPRAAGHRAAAPAAVRRGVLARARRAAARSSTAAMASRAPQARGDRRGGREPLPPMQVEFAGGHRIAVETEAVVKRESIFNSVGSLALILPLLFLVFRSLWLVVRRLAAVGAVARRRARRARIPGRTAVGRRHRRGGDAVRSRRRRRRAALRRAPAGARATASRRRHPVRASKGRATSMLLGMLTTAATFYGLMFVDFPSLRAARPAHRPQHGDLRRPDARHGAGAAAAASAAARAARAGHAASGRLDRSAAGGAIVLVARRALTVGLGVRRHAPAHRSDARSAAIDHRAPRGSKRRSVRRSACRATSTSCSPKVRSSSRCSRQRAARATALGGAAGPRVRAADAAAAVGRCAATTSGARSAQPVCRRTRSELARARARGRRTSRPAPSSRSSARLPRCSIPTSVSPTTTTSRTVSAI